MALNLKTKVSSLPELTPKKHTSKIWLKNYSSEIWFRASLLVVSFVLLVLIFSPNAVQLKDELRLVREPQQAQASTSARVEKLIDSQLQKANDEIKMLQEQIDTWF